MCIVTTQHSSNNPVGKIAKNSLKECIFAQIQYHIIKNTLLQTAFSAILLTGKRLLESRKGQIDKF